jgi:hypothetical protein
MENLPGVQAFPSLCKSESDLPYPQIVNLDYTANRLVVIDGIAVLRGHASIARTYWCWTP